MHEVGKIIIAVLVVLTISIVLHNANQFTSILKSGTSGAATIISASRKKR